MVGLVAQVLAAVCMLGGLPQGSKTDQDPRTFFGGQTTEFEAYLRKELSKETELFEASVLKGKPDAWSCWNAWLAALQLRLREESFAWAQKHLGLAEARGGANGLHSHYNRLANTYRIFDDPTSAAKSRLKALEILLKMDMRGTAYEPSSIPDYEETVANDFMEAMDVDSAVRHWKDALARWRALSNRFMEANLLGRCLAIALEQERWDDLQYFMVRCREMQKEVGPSGLHHQHMGVLANQDAWFYRPEGAPTFEVDGLIRARSSGDTELESQLLLDLGEVVASIDQWNLALRYWGQALGLIRQGSDKTALGRGLADVAAAKLSVGETLEAASLAGEALSCFQESHALRGKTLALTLLSDACLVGQDGPNAKEYAHQSLAVARSLRDPKLVADRLDRMGRVCLFGTGELAEAIARFTEALALRQTVGDPDGIVVAQNSLGYAYLLIGQTQTALGYFEASLAILAKTRTVREVLEPWTALLRVGALANLGRLGETEAECLRAIERCRTLSEHQDLTFGYRVLGELQLYQLGKPKDAESNLYGGIGCCQCFSMRENLGWSANAMGDYCASVGKWPVAENYHRGALDLFRGVGPQTQVPLTLASLAQDQLARGQTEAAVRNFELAITLIEVLRESLGHRAQTKGRFLDVRLEPYHRYADFLVGRGDYAKAFAVLQKGKARLLLDQVGGPSLDSKAPAPKDALELARLKRDADSASKRLLDEIYPYECGTGNTAGAIADAEQALLRWKQYQNKVASSNPGAPLRPYSKPASAEEIADWLDPDTAVLEYSVIKAGLGKSSVDRVLLTVAAKAGGKVRIETIPLAVKSARLSALASALRQGVAERKGPWAGPAKDLYQAAVAPAEKLLAGRSKVLVCPDGPLWEVPFHALLDGRGRTLWERFEVAYAFSASVAASERPFVRAVLRTGPLVVSAPAFRDTGKQVASRANATRTYVPRGLSLAPLPGSAKEARAISARYPGAVVLSGAAAQEGSLRGMAGKFRYVHFATHGFANGTAPLLSSLALASPPKGSRDDGFLTAQEVSSMSIPAELVVLSACDSGRGEVRRGEGLVGLAWAFHLAGSRSQIVTQWKVDDSSAPQLMASFYDRLSKGDSPSKALRSAALKLRGSAPTAHPYHWAPFILIGNP